MASQDPTSITIAFNASAWSLHLNPLSSSPSSGRYTSLDEQLQVGTDHSSYHHLSRWEQDAFCPISFCEFLGHDGFAPLTDVFV